MHCRTHRTQGTQLRTHRTQGTQIQRPVRQDATAPYLTQGNPLLMEAGQEEEGGGSVTPLGRSHQGGGEGGRRGGVEDPTMISLVLRFQSPEV